MLSDSDAATLFGAFAHPTRIAILRHLLRHAEDGRQFGDLAKALNISPSTLTHHLRDMEYAGVLCRKVCGRTTNLRLNFATLEDAVKQFTELCCCDGDSSTSEVSEKRI